MLRGFSQKQLAVPNQLLVLVVLLAVVMFLILNLMAAPVFITFLGPVLFTFFALYCIGMGHAPYRFFDPRQLGNFFQSRRPFIAMERNRHDQPLKTHSPAIRPQLETLYEKLSRCPEVDPVALIPEFTGGLGAAKGGVPARVISAGAGGGEANADSLCYGDPLAEMEFLKFELEYLLEQTRAKTIRYEGLLLKRFHKNTSVEVRGMLFIKRMLQALEDRYSQIETFLDRARGNEYDLGRAIELAHGPLEVAADSLNAVGTEKMVEPIPPEKWEETLDETFTSIATRQSFHRAIQILEIESGD